jgi:hypothetical protein
LALGCDAPMVSVNGFVNENGKRYKAVEGDEVQITFLWKSDGGSEMSAMAVFNNGDGSFKLMGPVGKGVPPGDYRVAIEAHPYPEGGPDRFKNQFNVKNSPLTLTVSNEPVQNIVIDVGTRTVTAN